MSKSSPPHILIFEPRTEGHHLSWLHCISENFLSAGFRLTLALDDQPESEQRIRETFSTGLIDEVGIIPVFNEDGKLRGGSKLKTVALCLEESGADEVLLPNFDEIASNCLRLAAMGIYPHTVLKGHLSGIYHRPRSLANPGWPPGNFIKTLGLRGLCRNGWFRHIWLLDEYLVREVRHAYPGLTFHCIPDPCEGDFFHTRQDARDALDIPPDKFVFLNYGIPARRKGLHIAVQAMLETDPDAAMLLLCAGQLPDDAQVLSGLEKLKARGQACVLDRYVTDLEEKLCFCASDAVLLPYIRHFGSSAVLSRAAVAGKMVIASDEGLIAKRVRDHHLGLLFPSENSGKLKKIMENAASLNHAEMEMFQKSAYDYTRRCSREAFGTALLLPYEEEDV